MLGYYININDLLHILKQVLRHNFCTLKCYSLKLSAIFIQSWNPSQLILQS